MAARRAIDFALDLARMPSLTTVMRGQALPPDLLDVIRVAAGCPEASKTALAETQKPFETIRAAAILYLEEMLFFPDAGLYRNLGVSAGASKAQMRLHMRWLLQWLHPDHNSDETAALLAARVINAWRELGRRDLPAGGTGSIGRQQPVSRSLGAGARRHRPSVHVRWIAVPIQTVPFTRRRDFRAAVFVLVAAAALALIFIPDEALFGWFSGPAKDMAASAATEGGSGTAAADGVGNQ